MAEAFQTTSEPKTTVDNYSYQETIEDLDKMNRELKEMKESMLKTNVRAYLLESELASLVNPELAESLRTVQETCKECTLAIKLEDLVQSND